MALAIEIEYLAKRYGSFEALRGVSLRVTEGKIFGLLGPNGAGKSTLVKSLLTILRPTQCRGSLLGQPIGHRRTLKKVGYLPEHARFPDYLTAADVVSYAAGLSGLSVRETKVRVPILLEKVGLRDWAKKKVGGFSKGMKQRVGIAQALVADPDLLFLDEPTDGVDPEGRIQIREWIEQMRQEGKTVFINSHLLAEVEQLADEVAILDRGSIVKTGTVDALTSPSKTYEIRTSGPVPLALRGNLEQEGYRVEGDRLTLSGLSVEQIQPLIDFLRKHGVVIREMKEVKQSLEDLFLQSIQSHRQSLS